METILFLTHAENAPSRLVREALGAALALQSRRGAHLHVGVIGADVQAAADALAGSGAASFLAVEDPELGVSRYGTDLRALAALVGRVAPTYVIAPATPRFSRVLPGLAVRTGGRIDTRVTGFAAASSGSDEVFVERWYYRQRIQAALTRTARPWILTIDAGSFPAWEGAGGSATLARIAASDGPVPAGDGSRSPSGSVGSADSAVPAGSADSAGSASSARPVTRTQVLGEEAGTSGAQTIRPDAPLLFVAGAGWTKKQADGQTHPARAEELILGFLARSGASLGSSKSLVDQSTEGEAVLSCLTHLHQVGQTGSTPRHPKGLATCCHGEEPHVVGWRFVPERRAINLDANCGWARGKADVVYVADAFAVMARVNELLGG